MDTGRDPGKIRYSGMKVEIDGQSGFCGGVIRAITTAEKFLSGSPHLYSLGAIVHNEEELQRLSLRGLVTIDHSFLDSMPVSAGETLLIRAHGEPPSTYVKAAAKGLDVIDCTCPVVLKLQKDIREAYSRLAPVGGSILIFGKIGHPEVLGLVGQAGGDAVVVETPEQLGELVSSGRVRTDRDIDLFSQTTMSPSGYEELCGMLGPLMSARLTVHRTICSQVASRHRELSDFALAHDAVVFVTGQHSSNGKVLFELCRSCNPRTFRVSSADGIDPSWFSPEDFVGVSGATSTPKWLLEEVARAIENLQ